MILRVAASLLMLANWVGDLAGQLDSPSPSGWIVAASTIATALVLFLAWAVYPAEEEQ